MPNPRISRSSSFRAGRRAGLPRPGPRDVAEPTVEEMVMVKLRTSERDSCDDRQPLGAICSLPERIGQQSRGSGRAPMSAVGRSGRESTSKQEESDEFRPVCAQHVAYP